ncbi:unnamed protein product [Microthlaspi erraticum]|uniref:Uncharacterized protein n=1 Tax=Microthlaspi erraticum TaxID=1685480 RepID=A0A6D2JNV5_9BRAS|nr:unnamed protein product [Microthlaspi erraticum]
MENQSRPTPQPYVQSPPNFTGDHKIKVWSENPKDRTVKCSRFRRYTEEPHPVVRGATKWPTKPNHGIGANSGWKRLPGASLTHFQRKITKRTSQTQGWPRNLFPEPY